MYRFNAEEVADRIVCWIREWFEENGKGCNAVVGISGGKDSSVTAALLVRALGRERVIGVMMPGGVQHDIADSVDLCALLGIETHTVNVGPAIEAVTNAIDVELNTQARLNLPPRIRMATLYAVSQTRNGRVANTCNLSEDWIGYSTRYGDSVGDFSPLSRLTVTEVRAVGHAVGLPDRWVDKAPSDGLCGKTDEDNLGFTYEMLDRFIREGIEPPAQIKEKIDRLHRLNQFKLQLMPCFEFDPFE